MTPSKPLPAPMSVATIADHRDDVDQAPPGALTLGDAVRASEVAAIPASPPAEVLDAIQTALGVTEWLEADDLHVRFAADGTNRVRIELQDHEGQTITELTSGEALNLVAADRPRRDP